MSIINFSDQKIGFLGAGQMAQAICKGIISTGSVKGSQIILADRRNQAFPNYQDYGVAYLKDCKQVVKETKIIFICVKPNVVDEVLNDVKDLLTVDHLLISVASGISLDILKKRIPSNVPVIRMMPNTPCLVREGAATFCCDDNVRKEHENIFDQLIKSNFPVLEKLSEKLIDASVGVSGSGPAYIYLIAEALSDGGVKMGLPRDVSNRLAYQTIKGAGEMLLQTGEHPGLLKDKVCSPSGNTIHAIHELERGSIRGTIINAVEASACRWGKKM